MAGPTQEVFGPYVVFELLGTGGMATVHRAIAPGVPRAVALKRVRSPYVADAELVDSFVREARLASRLSHPNIAQTYELGRVDETYYIAMELVDGIDLRRVLEHLAAELGPMPPAFALAIAIQICDALDYAHALGFVHRDVSPSNLMIARDGTVKVIDFGIAGASTASLSTASRMPTGKFPYLAPESLEGETDLRSDLFAVGVILHELLTARPLFKGASDFETLERVQRMPAPPPSTWNPSVTPELDRVVLTALSKDVTGRWQTAGQLRDVLGSLAVRPELRATPRDAARWLAGGRHICAAVSLVAPAPPLDLPGAPAERDARWILFVLLLCVAVAVGASFVVGALV